MNFEEWFKKIISMPRNRWMHGKNKKNYEGWMKGGWVGCKEEVLKILNETPLGYITEGEHEKLEKFADLLQEKIEKL